MPLIQFLPHGATADVPAGTLIHEAAIKAGIQDLELPCGAQGTCGQCLVEVEGRGLVMACQTRIEADAVVRIPENRETAVRVVGDSHFLVNEDLLPDPQSLSPLYRMRRIVVPPASIEEHYSDWNRLTRAAGEPLDADLSVLRELAATLRKEEGAVTIGVDATNRVGELYPGHVELPDYGMAIDVGTTTLALQAVNLESGRILATRTALNPQIHRGADIISRIDYARTPERLKELRGLVLEGVNGLVEEAGLPPGRIRAACVAGNTTMIHLLLGLPPRHIRESPYVPTVNPVPAQRAGAVGFAIHPNALVEFAPGVGSYVGGDITAGLLATELATSADQVFLFMDIGTNGEIVIGNRDWMVGCACSAGPAFEGSGIKCGMRAAEGAVEHVEIQSNGTARYRVIGGGTPKGICGSGLICLLGELLAKGIIDQAGHFHQDREFPFAGLVFTESDIENLIRTKAAIYAACSLILENVGLAWSDISKVYIAGGFGRYIQIADAILIGMLPDLPHRKFTYLGNSALTGAYIALLSKEHRERLSRIAAQMTYVDLSSDPRYMDAYVAAMFLPHTDQAQFPSVARRLARR